jgi:8-oxo-dGTP pyrophosphatase MutT (NUDIX family)
VEYDEDPVHALHREVLEETGLTIDPVAPVRMWSVIRRNGNQMVGVTWACRAVGNVRLSAEHVAYQWIARRDIPQEWEERLELEMVFHVIERLGERPAWFDHSVALPRDPANYRLPGSGHQVL